MRIVTDKNTAEEMISDYNNSLLDCFEYKKIINESYMPDKFLFFEEHGQVFPLVVKDGIVTFYGGMRHNHYNSYKIETNFLNKVLYYLESKRYNYRLLSLTDDLFPKLEGDYQCFDVPCPVSWRYNNIKAFTLESFLNRYPSKKRRKMQNILNHGDEYAVNLIDFDMFVKQFSSLIILHKKYFRDRGLQSVWEGNEMLLLKIIHYFQKVAYVKIKVFRKDQCLKGMYIMVYNETELLHYFGSSFDVKDPFISKLIYFDLLESAATLAGSSSIGYLDALPGSYGNKKRFGFSPIPLYALVHDPEWVIRRDDSLTQEEYWKLYGRIFGAEVCK